ncbi:MATE family efflux transporter [Nocardioides montaniterrae]
MSEPEAIEEIETAALAAPRGSTGGRAVVVTIDQALSSASNLLAMLWVAHAVSAVDFGSFSLLMLVYTFVMGPIHALVSMRVVVHPEDADERPRWVLGSSFVLGAIGGIGCAVVGGLQVAAGIGIGPAMLTLGLALPFLVVQDVGRWVAIARSRPMGSILLDGTWLVLMLTVFVVIHLTGSASLLTLTLAWAGTGALSALILVVQYGVLRPREISLVWLRERWEASWRLLVGNLAAGGSVLIGATLVAVVSSPIAVAAARTAIFLGRPASAVQNAVASSMAADVAREQPDNRALMRHQRRTLLIAAVVALINMVCLVLLPDAIGSRLLGNVWPVIKGLMLPTSLWLVVAAAQAGVPPALIGRHQFHLAMVVQVITGLISAAGLVIGATIDGAAGAVWGLVGGQAATALAWWMALWWHFTGSGQGGRVAKHRG